MNKPEIDRIECAIRHIQTAVDVDLWARKIAVEAMEKEISALQAQEAKAQLSAEGTTSDLISRREAIDVCNKAIDLWQGQLGEGIVIAVRKKIEELPSAQPERKNGRWEMKPDPFGFFGEIPVCSECGCTTKMRDKTKFCPHCGAQMEGQ